MEGKPVHLLWRTRDSNASASPLVISLSPPFRGWYDAIGGDQPMGHSVMNRFLLFALFAFTGLASASLTAQDAAPQQAELPPALKGYMGREIAQTMHYLGAEWLTRDEREREERASLMLENLGVKPGMTVCDMGCGNGYHTLRLAKMVGPEGKVLGVDIQREMLQFLAERAEKEGIANVEPIHGSVIDPQLPEGAVDLILCVDVYHEFSHPEHMLAAMRKSLAPGGRLVLVEFRAEDRTVPIKPLHKMTKKQINKELTANGYKLVKEYDELPWQHMMFFERDGAE
jgi:ubiquinone/menaquinone biosynthesis C-methylase UbiE